MGTTPIRALSATEYSVLELRTAQLEALSAKEWRTRLARSFRGKDSKFDCSIHVFNVFYDALVANWMEYDLRCEAFESQ